MGPSFTAMDVDAEPCLPEGSTAGLRGRLAPWLALAVLFVVAVALRHVLPANTDVSWLLTVAEPEAAAEALAEDGIRQEELRIPGLRRPFFGDADRALFIEAERFEMTAPEKDEFSGGKRLKRTVRFDLGRGAYATVVLRALGQ